MGLVERAPPRPSRRIFPGFPQASHPPSQQILLLVSRQTDPHIQNYQSWLMKFLIKIISVERTPVHSHKHIYAGIDAPLTQSCFAYLLLILVCVPIVLRRRPKLQKQLIRINHGSLLRFIALKLSLFRVFLSCRQLGIGIWPWPSLMSRGTILVSTTVQAPNDHNLH